MCQKVIYELWNFMFGSFADPVRVPCHALTKLLHGMNFRTLGMDCGHHTSFVLRKFKRGPRLGACSAEHDGTSTGCQGDGDGGSQAAEEQETEKAGRAGILSFPGTG